MITATLYYTELTVVVDDAFIVLFIAAFIVIRLIIQEKWSKYIPCFKLRICLAQ